MRCLQIYSNCWATIGSDFHRNPIIANPDVESDGVPDALGDPTGGVDLNRITARIIRSLDDMEIFTNPRSLPDPGSQVHHANLALFETVLPSTDWESNAGLTHIGWLLN